MYLLLSANQKPHFHFKLLIKLVSWPANFNNSKVDLKRFKLILQKASSVAAL